MRTSVLVVAHAADAGATHVAAKLVRRLGARAVRLLRPESLAIAGWSQRIGHDGRSSTQIALPDGTRIESGQLRAIFNRTRLLPAVRFRDASPKDRDYAGAELLALVASWLAELEGYVVPSARRHSCVLAPLAALVWRRAAAAEGLPVAPATCATSIREASAGRPNGAFVRRSLSIASSACTAGTVLVAGGEVGGMLAGEFGGGCRALSWRLGLPLIECRFERVGAGHALVDVDPMPSLEEPWAAELASRFVASLATRSPQ